MATFLDSLENAETMVQSIDPNLGNLQNPATLGAAKTSVVGDIHWTRHHLDRARQLAPSSEFEQTLADIDDIAFDLEEAVWNLTAPIPDGSPISDQLLELRKAISGLLSRARASGGVRRRKTRRRKGKSRKTRRRHVFA